MDEHTVTASGSFDEVAVEHAMIYTGRIAQSGIITASGEFVQGQREMVRGADGKRAPGEFVPAGGFTKSVAGMTGKWQEMAWEGRGTVRTLVITCAAMPADTKHYIEPVWNR